MSAVAELDPINTGRQQKTDAERFFATLWPDKLPGKLILWTLPDKETRVFDNVTDAAQAANELAESCDVYFACSLQAKAPKGKSRGTAAGVSAIPGLWLDLDVAGSGHKSKNYFATKDDAFAFLKSLPLKPTMLVWSGGGYHAYWLFNEPLQDTQRAAELSKGWQEYIRSQTDKDIDSTFDLSRVLRVAGTKNHKNGESKPVEIEKITGERFDPEDFEEFADLVPGMQTPTGSTLPITLVDQNQKAKDSPAAKPITRKKIVYDFKNAQPPAEKFSALREIEPRFDASWNRKRTNLKDTSPSAYDLSLASFAAHAGWTDQEIVNLIIAHRRKFHDLDKLTKRSPAQLEDYFFHQSYGCVKKSLDDKKALDDVMANIKDLKGLIKVIYATDPGSDERARLIPQLFPHLQKSLGLPIVKISKTSHDLSTQFIVTLAGSEKIIIKNITDFQNQKRWLDHAFNFAVNAGTTPPSAKEKEEWFVLQKALSLAVTLDFDPEADEIAETKAWVRRFAEFAPNYKYLETKDCEDAGCFKRDGLTWVRVDGLISDIGMKGGGRYKRSTMISRLKVAGFRRKEFTFTAKDGSEAGKRKTRSFFVIDYNKLVFDVD